MLRLAICALLAVSALAVPALAMDEVRVAAAVEKLERQKEAIEERYNREIELSKDRQF